MGGGMGGWPNGSGMGMGMPGGPSLSFPMPDNVSRGYSFEFQNLECTNSEISANCGRFIKLVESFSLNGTVGIMFFRYDGTVGIKYGYMFVCTITNV